MKNLLKPIAFAAFFTSCDNTTTENPTPSTKLDFSKFIAIGSSTTAGFMNGGLYRDGQTAAFPNLIAQQVSAKFEQPTFSTEQANGTGYWMTTANNTTPSFTKVSDKTAIRSTSPLLYTKYSGSINNYAVANLRMSDMGKAGLGNSTKTDFNPFFERILPTGKEDITYADFVKETKPTFFLMNLGNEDLLNFITTGGKTSMTETSVFTINCQRILDATSNAKGVIANVPNPLDFPYLNFLTSEAISHGVGFHDGIYITTGNGIIRLATNNDFILLDKITEVGKVVNGLQQGSKASPLPSSFVLDKDEASFVSNYVRDYNAVLSAEATKRNLALVDLNAVYKQIKDKAYDTGNATVKVDNSILTGGFFSLDGIYPTPRGQAIIANEFLKVINSTYKSQLTTLLNLLDASKFEALRTK